MITPKQVSESLEIPPSTIRRWSRQFQNHLSPHKPGKHRSYTPTDFDTLSKIKDMLNNGMTYNEIDKKLDVIPKENINRTTALLRLSDFTQIIEYTQATIATLQTKADNQDQRIKALEDWIALPWYRKMITKTPDFRNPTSD